MDRDLIYLWVSMYLKKIVLFFWCSFLWTTLEPNRLLRQTWTCSYVPKFPCSVVTYVYFILFQGSTTTVFSVKKENEKDTTFCQKTKRKTKQKNSNRLQTELTDPDNPVLGFYYGKSQSVWLLFCFLPFNLYPKLACLASLCA